MSPFIATANGVIRNPVYTAAAATVTAAQTKTNAYKDIATALKTPKFVSGVRSLVSFDPNQEPPRAAVGIGDLDTAQKVTYAVPGMGNDIGTDRGALTNWTNATQNLLNTEDLIDPTHSHAVIAAISYKSPELMSEPLSTDAQDGSARVASEIDAISAARSVTGTSVDVSALGHSYGTTVLSDALTKTATNVHDVVLLGSAGLQHQPDTFNVLATNGQPNVYATHAAADHLATIGYTTGVGHNIDPGDPAKTVGPPGAQATTRGGIAAQGVTILGSNGGTYDGVHYLATDGHGATGTSGTPSPTDKLWMKVGFEATAGQGYLDPQTESLRNAAAAAAGVPDKIVGPTILQGPK